MALPGGVVGVEYELANGLTVRWPSWDKADAWDVWDPTVVRQGARRLETKSTRAQAMAFARQYKRG